MGASTSQPTSTTIAVDSSLTQQIDMNSPIAKEIVDAISQNCIVIFSKTDCSFCYSAKNIFKKMNVPAKVIELNERKDGDEVMKVLSHMTKSLTVPQVFINGQSIGGTGETRLLHMQGKLRNVVRECPNF